MTNPGNAIGTNGAYSGRTSVEAFNDHLNLYENAGIVSGWKCVPSSGMTIALGGGSGVRDVAVAVAPSGCRTIINNRTLNPVNVTIAGAPTTGSRIDVVVAYANNPPEGVSTSVDNPGACGIISVAGTASSSPTAPTDTDIRTAITTDGGTGSSAYYVILATVKIAAGQTTITATDITAGDIAQASGSKLKDNTVTSGKIDWSSITDGPTGIPYKTLTLADAILGGMIIHRVGNLCIVQGMVAENGNIPKGLDVYWRTLPEGYRPISEASVPCVGVMVENQTNKNFGFRVKTDGTITWFSEGIGQTATGNFKWYSQTSVWITTDPWPTS